MTLNVQKTRVLIFIGSMRSGGKERRLIELLTFLKEDDAYDFLIVLTEDEIHYPSFYDLGVPYVVLPKLWKKNDFTVFYQFYKICKEYSPHLIHTWGRMQTFYTLPTVLRYGIPIINSQITSAPPRINKWSTDRLIDQLNFFGSKIILSNSKAGLDSFKPPLEKSRVIYNGINLSRFVDLPDPERIKLKYNILTRHAVVMSASVSPNKNYDLFCEVAEIVAKRRTDVTFIGVGQSHDDAKYKELLERVKGNSRILLPGRINDVEALVNACDIGVLFSMNGEGISNSIMEYMALGKPVIANEEGGTKELVYHNENGYLISNHSAQEVADMVMDLLSNSAKYASFGKRSQEIIYQKFSLEQMGRSFESVYREALAYGHSSQAKSVVTSYAPTVHQ
ncbi:glycosyltransferase [Pontibacter korlensis]|uniref:glycosyltransferase n=1 Tax=Pontibacter korlensis TaxID=400092 RepID=UPI0008FFD50E|nr:glycosyltransferase [Pontibacter korlensis]